jgi:FAD binding domain
MVCLHLQTIIVWLWISQEIPRTSAENLHSPLISNWSGDAMNLGWKLAATIRSSKSREGAPEGLLDSYFAERHPVGAKVLDWSRVQAAIMKPDAGARALNAILRDLPGYRDPGAFPGY